MVVLVVVVVVDYGMVMKESLFSLVGSFHLKSFSLYSTILPLFCSFMLDRKIGFTVEIIFAIEIKLI
jgi:hypothetical protein